MKDINISNRMTGSVVYKKDDLPISLFNLMVEVFQPVLEQDKGHQGFLVEPVVHIPVWVVCLPEASLSGHFHDDKWIELESTGSIGCQGDVDSVFRPLLPLDVAGSECRVRSTTIEEARFIQVENGFQVICSKDQLQLSSTCRDRSHIRAVDFAFIMLQLDPASLLEAMELTSRVGEVCDV